MGCVSCAALVKDQMDEMEEISLRLKEPVTLPVEADSICPDRFLNCMQREIEILPLFYGRREVQLGDLFEVEGGRSDNIVIRGDLRHVKRIGQGMSRGRITIRGDAGMHLGTGMRGGTISVYGNVSDWAGAHITGGHLHIHGNAGAMLGAAYPGETRGMNRGVVLVEGDAGPGAGKLMRRGLISVRGDLAEFAGAQMIAGSIFAFGTLGARAGAGMKRGTIVALGELEDGLLPVFRYACTYQPSFLRFYLSRLRGWGMPVTSEQIEGTFHRFTGDITTIGKGEILVYDQC